MISSLIPVVGGTAGVTPPRETGEGLLLAPADVLARRGYDGTRVADMAATVEVIGGALYGYFGSEAARARPAQARRRLLAEALAAEPGRPVTDLLLMSRHLLAVTADKWAALLTQVIAALDPPAVSAQRGAAP